jgi:hypothetical protein
MSNTSIKILSIFTTSIVSLLLVNSGNAKADRSNELPQQIAKNQYPQQQVSDYMKTCTQQAVSQKMSQQTAQTLCTCTINKFQAKYTSQELQKLMQSAPKNEEAADRLTEVGYACLEEVLYEE